jgi:hypothetical protein
MRKANKSALFSNSFFDMTMSLLMKFSTFQNCSLMKSATGNQSVKATSQIIKADETILCFAGF